MLEAVNSVVSNATMLRGNAEQIAATRSFAANPDRVQEVPTAPFLSPYVSLDAINDRAVLQLRDSNTGDIESQIPSEGMMARTNQILQNSGNIKKTTVSVESPTATGTDSAPKVEIDTSTSVSVEVSSGPPTQTGVPMANTQQLAAFEAGAKTASTGQSGNVSIEA